MGKKQITDHKDQKAKTATDGGYTITEFDANDTQKYRRLKAVYSLHKSMVKENMHKAMSPLSSISGYLELIVMLLQEGENQEQIEKYCSQIQEGVNEIGEIVENLYEVFHEEDFEESETSSNKKTVPKYKRPTG